MGGKADTDLTLRLQVNGRTHRIAVDARMTLLDVLREGSGLPAPRKGATTANAALARPYRPVRERQPRTGAPCLSDAAHKGRPPIYELATDHYGIVWPPHSAEVARYFDRHLDG